MSEELDALDRRMMKRALREGRKGRPSPNPHVGALIADGPRIVALAHHARAGEDHAEIAAIKKAGDAARGATLYCTLEPCNHFGRTPPCTDAIVAAGIRRMVIGCADPKPHVPGAIAKLVNAGISMVVGVCERECRALIADFARHRVDGLPYAILKAAITLDGRTAARNGDSKWITGEEARREAHRMRDRADAVLVGVNTVLADDPELTVRHVRGRDPLRVILDTRLRTPEAAKVVRHSSSAPTLIVHGPDVARAPMPGVELLPAPLDAEGRLDLHVVLRELAARDVVRLLVEGGSTVHGVLLRRDLLQHAALFVAPTILGDPSALPLADAGPLERLADGFRLCEPGVRWVGGDLLVTGDIASRERSAAERTVAIETGGSGGSPPEDIARGERWT